MKRVFSWLFEVYLQVLEKRNNELFQEVMQLEKSICRF